MSWGSNWGFSDPMQQAQSAAQDFLRTGNLSTYLGGTSCRSSSECASGYACSGGKCVPVNGSKPSSDGTLSGCGGTGGGPCDSLTDNNVGVKAGGDASMVYGDVVITKGGVSQGFYWEPVRSGDGCTISGCKLTSCGGENGSDCPGDRYCRYHAGGVQCQCGTPPPSPCSSFCDAHHASTGEEAGGCEGLTCDECSACDGNYFSSTYGQCVQHQFGPCHCGGLDVPTCQRCNEAGYLEDDPNCIMCTESSQLCSCGVRVTERCCYPLSEWTNGLHPINRCQIRAANTCAEECKPGPGYVDPCEGDCTPQTQTGPGTCPEQPSDLADGHRAVITGCIESGGNYALLYNDCDMTNVPDKCKGCDCNCHNDCPSCQLCGADGTCYPDPACEGDYTSTWRFEDFTFSFGGCSYSPESGLGGCVNWDTSTNPGYSFTTGCGPLPHSVVVTRTDTQTPYGPCVTGGSNTWFVIVDGDGNTISDEQGRGGIGGTYCGGPPMPAPGPTQVSIQAC